MRICEANTRILRAMLQSDIDAMPIKLRLPMPRFNASLVPRRIELCAGRGRKENAAATQSGARFPNGGPDGKSIPEFRLRLGCGFRMTPQAESPSQNSRPERDMLSGCLLKRKLQPGICSENGIHFPLHLPPRKTHALAIPKLGRRKPKRNRRRSI